jgi:hypothetical protein
VIIRRLIWDKKNRKSKVENEFKNNSKNDDIDFGIVFCFGAMFLKHTDIPGFELRRSGILVDQVEICIRAPAGRHSCRKHQDVILLYVFKSCNPII